jgi:hypothetical protein
MRRFLLILALLACCSRAAAQGNYQWNVTSGSGNWNNAANWTLLSGDTTGAAYPGGGTSLADTASFTLSSANGYCVLNGSYSCDIITGTNATSYISNIGTNTLSLLTSGTAINSLGAETTGIISNANGVLTLNVPNASVVVYSTSGYGVVNTTGGTTVCNTSNILAVQALSTGQSFRCTGGSMNLSGAIQDATGSGLAQTAGTVTYNGIPYWNGPTGLPSFYSTTFAPIKTAGLLKWTGNCNLSSGSYGLIHIQSGGTLNTSGLNLSCSGFLSLDSSGGILAQNGGTLAVVGVSGGTATAGITGINCNPVITYPSGGGGAVFTFQGSPSGSFTTSGNTLNLSCGSTGYTTGGTLNVPAAASTLSTALLGFSGSGNYVAPDNNSYLSTGAGYASGGTLGGAASLPPVGGVLTASFSGLTGLGGLAGWGVGGSLSAGSLTISPSAAMVNYTNSGGTLNIPPVANVSAGTLSGPSWGSYNMTYGSIGTASFSILTLPGSDVLSGVVYSTNVTGGTTTGGMTLTNSSLLSVSSSAVSSGTLTSGILALTASNVLYPTIYSTDIAGGTSTGTWNATNLTLAKVDSGTTFGANLSLTGTDVGGSWNTSPGSSNVNQGVSWEYLGVSYTGSLSSGTGGLVPDKGYVLSGILVGSSTGTLVLPPTTSTLAGTVYGVSGNGSTGTFVPPRYSAREQRSMKIEVDGATYSFPMKDAAHRKRIFQIDGGPKITIED